MIMPHFKKAFPSKYLQAADLDVPIVATIKSVVVENVGSGDDLESKLVATFREDIKGCVLNLTRAEAIAAIVGDEDTDRWVGTRIRLSRGTTRFGGKRVSCIVVDDAPPMASPQSAATSAEMSKADSSADDSIPF